MGSDTEGVMIRGVSDYAGRKQQTETKPDDWKSVCVANAAIVAAQIIKDMYAPHDEDCMRRSRAIGILLAGGVLGTFC